MSSDDMNDVAARNAKAAGRVVIAQAAETTSTPSANPPKHPCPIAELSSQDSNADVRGHGGDPVVVRVVSLPL